MPRIWPLSRYPELLPSGEAFIRKWGVLGIFIGRFFGPLRASVPLAAGIFEMPYWRFQFANFTSAFVWAATLSCSGTFDRREVLQVILVVGLRHGRRNDRASAPRRCRGMRTCSRCSRCSRRASHRAASSLADCRLPSREDFMTDFTRRSALGAAARGRAAAVADRSAAGRRAAGRQAGAGVYRYKVGDIEVTVVTDGGATFRSRIHFVRNATKDQVNAALQAAFIEKDKFSFFFNPSSSTPAPSWC